MYITYVLRITGQGKHISVSKDQLWGVSPAGEIYMATGLVFLPDGRLGDIPWRKVDGHGKQLCVHADDVALLSEILNPMIPE